MKNIVLILLLFLFGNYSLLIGQSNTSAATISGLVIADGDHVSYVSVSLKGTTIGTVTDETGYYQLTDLPVGRQEIVVSMLGYKTIEKEIQLLANETTDLTFELEEDALHLEEVVVSADRSEIKRVEAPVIVTTISADLFANSQAVTLGEGLNFAPGLRVENNCQNCGFSQVRMNGMEGPYSQILINSRPVFSGLAGVYGLELIPSNMVERVEVVRGGGSSLYGSNAIAGTINIILKEPKSNSYQAGINYGLLGAGSNGDAVSDYTINVNTALVSDDHKSGVSLYGFTRNRQAYDANEDSFSEIAPLENLTFGTRIFHRFGDRDKLALDFFSIHEERNGGNEQDLPLHERDIAETLTHDFKVAGLTYERYFRDFDLLSAFVSAQFLNRDSYYGAEQSLQDYGKTTDHTYNAGLQYKAQFDQMSLILGVDHTGGDLLDKKLAYPDLDNAVIENGVIVDIPHTENTIITDQSLMTSGVFAQYELRLKKLKLTAGARIDHYEIKDHAKNEQEIASGTVLVPRLSLMYELQKYLQARASYSMGYRAPQIFDEDLHIETSGSRQVLHQNAEDLKQETSHSYMLSLDFNKLIGTVYTGFLLEGFYTQLDDAFVYDYGTPDDNGTVVYTRVNAAGGAKVQGLNMELKLKPLQYFSFASGFTIQKSIYEEEQDFAEKSFFRTPEQYGYFTLDWDFKPDFCLTATGNYTGSMLVPYFGTQNPEGELRSSEAFFDFGTRLAYTFNMNNAEVEFFGGVKNIFNSYQSDFDTGIERDPAYIYGPMAPRTVYVGLKFGNFLGK